MSKASKEFFEQINELIMTREYNEEVVDKLVNMSVVARELAAKESDEKIARLLINIGLVAKSLAGKLYALKDK